MWPFRKRIPTLDVETYRRWLRAQRPPFELFLAMSPLEQQALAEEGDAHVLHVAYEVLDPAPAQEDQDGAQGAADEEKMQQAAMRLAERLMRSQGRTAPSASTAGFKERRGTMERADRAEKDAQKSFAGRPPNGTA